MICRSFSRYGQAAQATRLIFAPIGTSCRFSVTLRSQRSISSVSAPATSVRASQRPKCLFSAAAASQVTEAPSQPTRSYSSTSEARAVEPPASDLPTLPEKPDFLDEAESVIWDRLVSEFAPVELVVQDISGGCGSMYGIEISSERFRDVPMLKQQRMVNAILGDLMKGWHGVQLKTRVP